MNYRNQSRNNISTNILPHYSPKQKQNQSANFLSLNDKHFDHNTQLGRANPNQTIKENLNKIIQWRKNNKFHLVALKKSLYPIINPSYKSAQIPTSFEVEKIVQRLDEFRDLSVPESMYVLSCLLEGYSNIRSFFGFISFELRFCGISTQGKVKIWINQNFEKNEIEGQVIRYESECVSKIIQQVKKISATQFSQFYTYYLRNARKHLCDFKYTQQLVKSFCLCTKQLPIQRLKLPRKQKNSTSIHLIPQSKHTSPQFDFRASITSNNSLQKQKIISMISPKTQNTKIINNFQKNLSLKQIQQPKEVKITTLLQEDNETIYQKCKKHRISSHYHDLIGYSSNFNSSKSPKTSNIIKKSEVSTNYNTQSQLKSNNKSSKTQDQGMDWAFTTFNKVKNLPTHQSQNNIAKKLIHTDEKYSKFLFENVREVDCNSQSSVEVTEMRKSQINNPEKRESQIFQQEKGEQMIKKNHWTNKIDNLFTSSELKESRVVGRDLESSKLKIRTQKLDKWARVIGQSMLPQSNNCY